MKVILALATLALAATPVQPQRCGDALLLYLRDRGGRVIRPAEFESATVSATYTADNVADLVAAAPEIKDLPPRVKSFSVRVVCGMKAAQFRLKYKGEAMTLRVLNVPGDAGHILLEGISFRKGLYEVDLGGRPLRHAQPYQGEGSKAADPADEIAWVVRDSSLRKPSRQQRQTIEQLAKTLADAYAAKAMSKLDAARPYLQGVRIVIQDSLDDDRRQARRVKTLAEAERRLRRLEREDGTPLREARPLARCGRGRCTYNLDGGIDHNHLYITSFTYGYRNRAPYIKTIFLLDGD